MPHAHPKVSVVGAHEGKRAAQVTDGQGAGDGAGLSLVGAHASILRPRRVQDRQPTFDEIGQTRQFAQADALSGDGEEAPAGIGLDAGRIGAQAAKLAPVADGVHAFAGGGPLGVAGQFVGHEDETRMALQLVQVDPLPVAAGRIRPKGEPKARIAALERRQGLVEGRQPPNVLGRVQSAVAALSAGVIGRLARLLVGSVGIDLAAPDQPPAGGLHGGGDLREIVGLGRADRAVRQAGDADLRQGCGHVLTDGLPAARGQIEGQFDAETTEPAAQVFLRPPAGLGGLDVVGERLPRGGIKGARRRNVLFNPFVHRAPHGSVVSFRRQVVGQNSSAPAMAGCAAGAWAAGWATAGAAVWAVDATAPPAVSSAGRSVQPTIWKVGL